MRKRSRFNIDQLFIDVMTTLCAMFVAMLAIVTLVSKIDNKTPEQKVEALSQAGNVVIDARWPDGLPVDVDLWVQAPEDKFAVGYSRRADRQSSYVRDDTGMSNDPGDLNYENVFVRGLKPGRYVVNVHMYHGTGSLPVKVRVTASVMPTAIMPMQAIKSVEVELTENGQELTAFSFELDNEGHLVPGSISQEFIRLRNPE